MNKKEFYEAPEWGLRVVLVQRHLLADSNWGEEDTAGKVSDEDDDHTFTY